MISDEKESKVALYNEHRGEGGRILIAKENREKLVGRMMFFSFLRKEIIKSDF
jgi:hypothetical protein